MLTNINIPLSRNVVTHNFVILNKLQFIKDIRSGTQCSLAEAKHIADKIDDMFKELKPAQQTVYSLVMNELVQHQDRSPENLSFLMDVLQFMKTTSPANLRAHNIPVGTFKENGDYEPYDPVKEKSMYHTCDDACLHECEHAGCDRKIAYHDEPYCFTHSPDSGSSVPGYDSRNSNPF
jgi:hypothetical protein